MLSVAVEPPPLRGDSLRSWGSLWYIAHQSGAHNFDARPSEIGLRPLLCHRELLSERANVSIYIVASLLSPFVFLSNRGATPTGKVRTMEIAVIVSHALMSQIPSKYA